MVNLERIELIEKAALVAQEIKDIENRLRNENAEVHQIALAKAKKVAEDITIRLANLPLLDISEIEQKIIDLRTQAASIFQGFTGSSSADRREADQRQDLVQSLNEQADKLQLEFEQMSIIQPEPITTLTVLPSGQVIEQTIQDNTLRNALIIGGAALLIL